MRWRSSGSIGAAFLAHAKFSGAEEVWGGLDSLVLPLVISLTWGGPTRPGEAQAVSTSEGETFGFGGLTGV